MKPSLVSPDFFSFTFGFTFRKHTGNISISEIAISNLLSKIQRIYQVIFNSSNHQRSIRVSYDMILFIVIVKRDECRNPVNIGYS